MYAARRGWWRIRGLNSWLQPCKGCTLPAELIPHIPQNTSRTIYLLSAETLLSWSAEPHRIRLPRELGRTSIKSIKLHILPYTEFFSCPKRVASSRSKADNQKTVKHNTLQPNRNQTPLLLEEDTCQQESPPYPLHTLRLGSASLSVHFEQGKVNIYL